MQTKEEVYAEQIHPIVETLAELCREHELPLLVAVCLDMKELADRKAEVMLAGATNLDDMEDVPSMMKLAASILHIPGYCLAEEV